MPAAVKEISRADALRAARSLAAKVAELQAAPPPAPAEPATSDVRILEMPVQDVRPHSYELRVTERDADGLIVSAIIRPVEIRE